MKYKKGDKLKITEGGISPLPCNVEALKDFDTEKDEWYSVKLDQYHSVHGINKFWNDGDELPCRRGINKIEKR